MTLNGVAYELPTWEPATDVSASSSLLPTPSASVANDGETTQTWLARRERVKLTAANGNGMGMPLTIASLLIGEPTRPQSTDGEQPWEDVPLPLLSQPLKQMDAA